MEKPYVCIVTTVNPVFDGRIFHRHAKTLVGAGYRVSLMATHEKNEVADGIEITALPRSRNRFTRILRSLTVFKRVIGIKADIYHFHDPELLPAMMIVRLLTKKPIIYDVHEDYGAALAGRYWIPGPLRPVSRLMFNAFESLAIKLMQAILYTTPLIGRRYGGFRGRLVRVDCYPSLAGFARKPIAKTFAKIVHMGSMTEIRGILELIQAFAKVSERFPEATLEFIGRISPDSFRVTVEQLVSKLKLREKVRVKEAIPYEQVAQVLAEGFVGVISYLPYPNHVVTLPNKMFEYMATATPIVASDFPLYREVLDADKCGLLVDPTKPDEIAEAISVLLSNPQEAAAMGERGRQAFVRTYNWEKESKKLLGLYSELLTIGRDPSAEKVNAGLAASQARENVRQHELLDPKVH